MSYRTNIVALAAVAVLGTSTLALAQTEPRTGGDMSGDPSMSNGKMQGDMKTGSQGMKSKGMSKKGMMKKGEMKSNGMSDKKM